MKITFICGLPGSGKTYLGEQLSLADDNVTYLDDITVRGGLNELQDAINVLGADNIVVSDVFLCRKKDREAAVRILGKMAPEYALEWVFFENAPDKCMRNVEHRNKNGDSRAVKGLIQTLTKEYTIPEGVTTREIWQMD
jgi:predicted kinase